MVILERPYISKELKEYLNENKVKVLKNKVAAEEEKVYRFNLLEDQEFIEAYGSGSRLYTTSENSLEWIYENIADPQLLKTIDRTKNKVRFRELIQSVYPELFFCAANIEELDKMDFASLKKPFILKPAVGFFSVGVYTIYNEKDWKAALADIAKNQKAWAEEYPDTVVGNEIFILEEYIEGDEYAIDAYYNEKGEAVVLNILKHDFSGERDVSDRLYYTSAEIIEKWAQPFTEFLNQINSVLEARNFPAHIEVRVKDGRIVPIEFNPMRFAGWCTTDLSYFAFGFLTYDYYLRNLVPDWKELLSGKKEKLYSIIVLDKPSGIEDISGFDFEALAAKFSRVLSLRKIDYRVFPVFGFLFTENDAGSLEELDQIMRSDLREFIVP